MNKSVLLKKGLVVGIIILFVGVGAYPAVAVSPISSTNIKQEEVIDTEEDCGCNPVDSVKLEDKEILRKSNSNVICDMLDPFYFIISMMYNSPGAWGKGFAGLMLSLFFYPINVLYDCGWYFEKEKIDKVEV